MLAAVKRRSFALVRLSQTREQLSTETLKSHQTAQKLVPTWIEEECGNYCKLMHTQKQHNWATYHLERKAKQRHSLRVRHYSRLWLYTLHYNDTSVYYSNAYTYFHTILYYSHSYWETKSIEKWCWTWTICCISILSSICLSLCLCMPVCVWVWKSL